jgi:hypothetical protein
MHGSGEVECTVTESTCSNGQYPSVQRSKLNTRLRAAQLLYALF